MRREITGDGKLIIGLITAICLLINEPETYVRGIVELPFDWLEWFKEEQKTIFPSNFNPNAYGI